MTAEPWTDDTQLAAYLAGELDEVTARRIDERLADDPALGERLDRVHDALLTARAPDRVTLPSGLPERLAERLEQEWAAVAPVHEGPAPQRWLSRQRGASEPGAWSRRWQVPLGAAAAVVLAAVVAANVLPLGAGDDAAEAPGVTTFQADSRQRATMQESDADEEVADQPEAEESAPEALQDADALGDADESRVVPPIPREDAPAVAEERWEEMPARQSACRDDVEQAAPGPVVPLRVHDDRADERPVLVFEIATATADEETLAALGWVVVDATTCDVIDRDVP